MVSGGYQSSDSQQEIDPVQRQFLSAIWSQGESLLPEQMQNIRGRAVEAATEALGIGGPAAALLGRMATGDTAGQRQLRQNMQAQSPWLNQQISNLGEDINQNLSRNIMPQIRSGGVAAGSPGGSRAGIAEGLAMQGAQDAFARQSAAMRHQDVMRQQTAAQGLIQSQVLGAQGSIGSMAPLYDMNLQPFQSAWMPLQMQAGLLGNPTVIGDSSSRGYNFGILG